MTVKTVHLPEVAEVKNESCMLVIIITFRMTHGLHEMYSGHSRLCVCVSVPHRIPMHTPGCNLEEL